MSFNRISHGIQPFAATESTENQTTGISDSGGLTLALVQCSHPKRGNVPGKEFIPIQLTSLVYFRLKRNCVIRWMMYRIESLYPTSSSKFLIVTFCWSSRHAKLAGVDVSVVSALDARGHTGCQTHGKEIYGRGVQIGFVSARGG